MSYQVLHTKSLRHQQGVAVIVALFIVALVAAMSYFMISALERDTERTTLIVREAQAELAAQGAILWAMNSLKQNWERQQPNQLIDKMPLQSPLIESNGFRIQATIEDMQGRYNINNLAENVAMNEFVRLLQVTNPSLSRDQAIDIFESVMVWLNQDLPHQQLNEYYFSRPIPYQNAGRKMMIVTELSMIKGITPAIYTALSPYLSTLPQVTKINVQTAPVPVLMALGTEVTKAVANQIVLQRQSQPFVTVDMFSNLDVVKNHHVPLDQVGVTSSYFLVRTEVKIEDQRLVIDTLLVRTVKDKKAKVTIIWQSKGAQ